ncbi:CUB and sushi domain-containing protein 3-like [Mya arenaria]|uniref:CUB and sushi domain-containing protein 3-like n=1 Tax=Mya arenaria TaxID=6604 RepID=UPI0022E431F4|nr:CUB and sushi domain-containing protein 3-like [Mya arenaria]
MALDEACPDPTPTNGSSTLYDSGQFALISCDTGFTMNGENYIECVNDTWSTNTTCQIVDCGDPTPTSGSVDSGDTTYLSVVTVTCDSGYDISGSDVITCQSTGSWNATPTCERKDCGSPAATNGAYSGGTLYDQTATLSCDTGYNLQGPEVVYCDVTGWNGTATCNIVDCGDPTPNNGSADIPSGTTYNEPAAVTCDTGFTRNGSSLIVCQADGTWSATPTCAINDCGDPVPSDGSANDTGTTYGTVLSISCNTGWLLSGSPIITCEADSAWSGTPTCDPYDCGDPVPENGASTYTATTLGETATLACNNGYTLSGDTVVTVVFQLLQTEHPNSRKELRTQSLH